MERSQSFAHRPAASESLGVTYTVLGGRWSAVAEFSTMGSAQGLWRPIGGPPLCRVWEGQRGLLGRACLGGAEARAGEGERAPVSTTRA